MTLAPDTTVGGRYRLVERIAVGGMGEVWRASDDVLGRDVAVKVLKAEYAADPTFLQRFRNEARHTAALSHPGIANVFDYGEVGEMAYLVMELVGGEPLSALLAREAPLEPGRALDILGQAALALQAAHDVGVVHRDVKPGNVLVRPDGVVKVTDFGIARAVDTAPITQTGLLMGTAAYLSPEQAAGRVATPASDIYSLGVVGYECLTGRRPFHADSAIGVATAHINNTPDPLPDTVPPLVSDFVMRALEKDPAKRQPNAGDFGRTALALVGQLDPPPPATSAETEPATTATPKPTETALLTVPVPDEPAPASATGDAGTSDDDRERRRVRNIFVAIGVAVVALGFVLLRSCTDGGVDTAKVPRVVGDQYKQAVHTLRARGFDVEREGRSDRFVAPGTVLAQSVKRGVELPVGRTITLTVSTGAPSVTIDEADYVGRPFPEVSNDLTSMHLVVHSVLTPSDAEPGTVTAVDPTGSVREGETVTVTVAVAPTPSPKTKPPKHDHKGHER